MLLLIVETSLLEDNTVGLEVRGQRNMPYTSKRAYEHIFAYVGDTLNATLPAASAHRDNLGMYMGSCEDVICKKNCVIVKSQILALTA